MLPFVENFTKSDYLGDNQNWSIVQGADHAMYFANNHYFLRFNGVKWEKYTLPNQTIIRALARIGDRIYSGSYREFGYWERVGGTMKYTSLSAGTNLFAGGSANEEIWKIFENKGTLYFQSFNELYCLGKTGIRKVKFPYLISYCYVVNGSIYAATVRDGIYRMDADRFVKVPGWEAVDGSVVHAMQVHQGKLYVFTKNRGIFIEESHKLKAFEHPLNEVLKRELIINAQFLPNNRVSIGTSQQGLYLINLNDGTFQRINRQNGLRNNAVLSQAMDGEHDLWLGLDNGIAHVEVNAPVSLFTDNSGLLGSVYSVADTPQGYLFVTNHGVFSYTKEKLELLPDTQGQVWDITRLDDRYIIGHNDGTFLLQGASIQKVNDINGGWKFFKSASDQTYYQGHYSGVVRYAGSDFANPIRLKNFTHPIRDLAQVRPGELWAADNYRSLYRIELDSHGDTKQVENVSQQSRIGNDFGVRIFSFKGELLFLIAKQWYTYNRLDSKLKKDVLFNDKFKGISDIVGIDDGRFLVLRDALVYLVSQKGNGFYWELIPEKYYQGRLIYDDTKTLLQGNRLVLNLDDGILKFNLDAPARRMAPVRVEGYLEGKLLGPGAVIPYNKPFEINVVSPFFGYNRPELYYRLNESNDFERIRDGRKVFNNLSSGSQKLELFYFDGSAYRKTAAYDFRIARPWYFSWWMILIYLVATGSLFFLYYRWNLLRYNQRLVLREEELRHNQQIRELELKAEHDGNRQSYEKHILELELQAKSGEVAGKSLSIAKQSEMIDKIKEILDREEDGARIRTEILRAIKTNAVNRHEWEVFENNVNQLNQVFIDNLSAKYPQLTPKDIKLCVYLKMNLSSKEIAPLMNITFRGVELHRYRLRKKLKLPSEANLYHFMRNI